MGSCLPSDDDDVDDDEAMKKVEVGDMDTVLNDIDVVLFELPGKRMTLITSRGRAERRVLGCL